MLPVSEHALDGLKKKKPGPGCGGAGARESSVVVRAREEHIHDCNRPMVGTHGAVSTRVSVVFSDTRADRHCSVTVSVSASQSSSPLTLQVCAPTGSGPSLASMCALLRSEPGVNSWLKWH